jgi:3-oxoadipate enol-lactonase
MIAILVSNASRFEALARHRPTQPFASDFKVSHTATSSVLLILRSRRTHRFDYEIASQPLRVISSVAHSEGRSLSLATTCDADHAFKGHSMPAKFSTGSFKTSDDCTLTFELRCAGNPDSPRVTLIHPLALSSAVWHKVAQDLGDRVHLLTYDCRGHGSSEKRASRFTTDLFARDLAELFEHIGWDDAIVAGCSMGGCVAQAFAATYPQHVSALGLIDTTAWYGIDAAKNWGERAAKARKVGLTAMAEFQASRWFSEKFRHEHGPIVSAVHRIFIENDTDCYIASCLMLGEADLRPLLPSITIPVAIVVGEEDYATPILMSRQMHECIPQSSLRILSGVRHLSPVESPQEISATLLELSNRVSTVRSVAQA